MIRLESEKSEMVNLNFPIWFHDLIMFAVDKNVCGDLETSGTNKLGRKTSAVIFQTKIQNVHGVSWDGFVVDKRIALVSYRTMSLEMRLGFGRRKS